MPTQSKGYFIAPSGDIIPIMDTHIRTVLDNPKKNLEPPRRNYMRFMIIIRTMG